jgi:hypothetical protein
MEILFFYHRLTVPALEICHTCKKKIDSCSLYPHLIHTLCPGPHILTLYILYVLVLISWSLYILYVLFLISWSSYIVYVLVLISWSLYILYVLFLIPWSLYILFVVVLISWPLLSRPLLRLMYGDIGFVYPACL